MSKKSGKVKKAPKAKAQVKTQWDDLDLSTLEEKLIIIKAQYNNALQERVQVQTEYDAVVSYYNVTKNEIDALKDEIKLINYFIEQSGEEFLEEHRMYEEKRKQLNYDFKRKVELTRAQKAVNLQKEEKEYKEHLKSTECKVFSTQVELRERQIVNTEQIRQQKERFNQEVATTKQKLNQDLQTLINTCAQQEKDIGADLDLKRAVELRDMTEQMNLHIFGLEQKHEELYVNTKTQYSNTSTENCTNVERLEEECVKVHKDTNMLKDHSEVLQEENDRLSVPLAALTSKINLIKIQIKDKDKNRQYLCNVKARKILVLDRIGQQEEVNLKLLNEYDEMKQEYDELDREIARLNSTVELEMDPDKDKAVKTAIENAVSHLQAFKEASINDNNDDKDIFINGSKLAKDTEDGPSLETSAMESQQAFSNAVWRLNSEHKSVELGK